MRKKIYYRKLVRNKIPNIIKSKGEEYSARILDDVEFEQKLKKKLIEESKEVQTAPADKLLYELADVIEVVKTLAKLHKIQFKDILKIQQERKKARGGFSKRIFLEWSGDQKYK